MTDAPAVPVPSFWGGTNTPPQSLDVCTHAPPVPPPEVGCCADRLLYSFAPPSVEWVIDHNKGKYPASVQVIATDGVVTDSCVRHTNLNQTVITHTYPYAGTVILLV